MGRQKCGFGRSYCVASGNLCFGGAPDVWADGPSYGTFVLPSPKQRVRLTRPHSHCCAVRSPLQWSERSCSKGVVRGLGKWNGAKVHLERPGFTFCRVGEGVGWHGNNRKDGREVQVCFGHGELSGSSRSLGSCSPQGLRVRSRTASQWCGVRTTGRSSKVLDVVAYCIWTALQVRLMMQLK